MTDDTVGNHLWLWCHVAGCYNGTFRLSGMSDYTPVEAAAYLGVDNIIMVVYDNQPAPPFEPVQRKFDHFDRVIWSVVGDALSNRNVGEGDLREVIDLARRHPNIRGGIMDDFFDPGRPGFALEAISTAMRAANLPLWVVLYAGQLDMPGIAEKLAYCDVVTFWTWNAADLDHLGGNFARARALAPDKRFVLGCYLWNFGAETPVLTEEHMERQCAQGLEWLRRGEIDDLILLGSPLLGMDVPTLAWTREWVKRVKNLPR